MSNAMSDRASVFTNDACQIYAQYIGAIVGQVILPWCVPDWASKKTKLSWPASWFFRGKTKYKHCQLIL